MAAVAVAESMQTQINLDMWMGQVTPPLKPECQRQVADKVVPVVVVAEVPTDMPARDVVLMQTQPQVHQTLVAVAVVPILKISVQERVDLESLY
jgi:hypothetical protein